MSEHDAFRRAFADLDAADDPSTAWRVLAARLEVHAVAEERLFYPVLADEADTGAEDGKAAVHEHNDIRHAVADVAEQPIGSDPWWEAVRRAQQVNGDHMAEEEREFIPEFKESVDAQRRDALGMEWLRLHDQHEDAQGLSGEGGPANSRRHKIAAVSRRRRNHSADDSAFRFRGYGRCRWSTDRLGRRQPNWLV